MICSPLHVTSDTMSIPHSPSLCHTLVMVLSARAVIEGRSSLETSYFSNRRRLARRCLRMLYSGSSGSCSPEVWGVGCKRALREEKNSRLRHYGFFLLREITLTFILVPTWNSAVGLIALLHEFAQALPKSSAGA